MRIKRFRIITILFLFIFLIPFSVHAEDVSCSTILETIDEYNAVVDELEETDCEDTLDSDTVKLCNDDTTKKAFLLSKLFKYNDQTTCQSPQLKKIINENKDQCSNIFNSDLKDLTNNVMSLFYIIAPFLFIIFGSLDFSKIVTAGSNFPEVYKKSKSNFIKRLIAFLLIYITPAFVNFVLGLNLSNYTLTGDVYSCKTDYIYHMNRWETTYIPPVTTSSSSASNSNLGLGSNNGIFQTRTSAPTSSNSYYDWGASNLYQCVWYAQHRAIEALSTSNLSESEKNTKLSLIRKSNGNGWAWYPIAVSGHSSVRGDDESTASEDSLIKFQSSNDYTKPRAGSLVAWRWTDKGCTSYWGQNCNSSHPEYGHVGFIEDVDTTNNKVLLSEGWKKSDGGMGFQSIWVTFDELKNLRGKCDFEGYVYLMDPLK